MQVMKDIEQQQISQQQQWLSQRAAGLKAIIDAMFGTAGCCCCWSRF